MSAEDPKHSIYGIVGTYENPPIDAAVNDTPNANYNKVAFGGVFKTKIAEEGSQYPLDLRGQIIDMWGAAKIEGNMSDSELKFTKTYTGDTSKPPLEYTLSRKEDNLEGSYSSEEFPEMLNGQANGQLFLYTDEASEILVGPIQRR